MSRLIAIFFSLVKICLFFSFVVHAGASEVSLHQGINAKKILVLYSYNYSQPAQQQISDGIESARENEKISPDCFVHEYLDISPQKSPEQRQILRQLLMNKYHGRQFDLIITVFNGALDFLINDCPELSPDSQCLALYAQERPGLERGGKRIVQSPLYYDIAGTLELALKLFPGTKRVLFVSGQGEIDRIFEKKALEDFTPWLGRLEFEFTSKESVETIIKKSSALSQGSIVIYSRVSSDITGKTYQPGEIASRLSFSSTVPVFCIATSQLKSGVVGGVMVDVEGLASMLSKALASVIEKGILDIEPASNFARPMLDWTQLEKWGVTNKVPVGSVIVNRPRTIWHQYREMVVASAIVFVILIMLIVCLIAFYIRQRRLVKESFQNELLFRSLFEMAPYSVTLHDLDGRYIMANEFFLEDKGLKKDEVIGKTMAELLGDIFDHEAAERDKKYILENGMIKNRTFVFTYKDKIRASIYSARLIQFNNAQHFLSISVDLSELIQTQEALKKSEEKFRKIVENLPLAIGIADYDGEIIYLNPYFIRLFGYKIEDVPKVSDWLEKVYPDPEYRREVSLSWQSDIDAVTNDENVFLPSRVYRICAKDKTNLDVEINSSRIDNKIYTVFHDVTEQKRIEKELQQSEEKYRVLFKDSIDAYAIIDEGIIIEHNKAAADMFRVGINGLAGRTPGSLSPEFQPNGKRSEENAFELIDDVYKKGTLRFEWVHQKSDGVCFWVEVHVSVMTLHRRKVLFASWRDISQRKTAEKILVESEGRARVQRTAIAELAVGIDLDSSDVANAIRHVTEILASTIGVGRSSVWKLSSDHSGLECLDLYESDKDKHTSGVTLDPNTFQSYFKAIITENRVYAEDAIRDERTRELSEFYLKPLGITSLLDAGIFSEGRLVGIVSCEHIGEKRKWHSDEESFVSTVAAIVSQLYADTERKNAVEALRESEERYKSVITVSNTGVWEYHTDSGYVWCSPTYFEMLGLDHGDFVFDRHPNLNEVWGSLLHPDDMENSHKVLEQYIANGLSGMYENIFRMRHKSGSWVWIFSRGQALRNSDGNPRNLIVGTNVNITEIKEAQLLIAEKNKELEQIIYVTSHDLRSPLVNVDGYGRELEYSIKGIKKELEEGHGQEEKLKIALGRELPDMIDSLKHIRSSTLQMDALLKGLLKLSRSGRSSLHIEPLEMNDLVGRIMSVIEFQVKESGAEVSLEKLPPCRGDAVQVEQVFSNIIGNALKYLDPDRSGKIRITGRIKNGNSVYCVEDNGIGISPAHQGKIFELFHRLEPHRIEGEGLGLTIVRQILRRLEGDIMVESEPGQGSRFFVTLPYAG